MTFHQAHRYTNMLFDTHGHYTDLQYKDDLDKVLTQVKQAGVEHLITCGTTPKDSLEACKIAEKYDFVYFTAGIHPQECGPYSLENLDDIEKLAKHEKCKAIGECGLDYSYDDCAPRHKQIEFFESQCILAKKLGLPVVVHDREAHGDTFEVLKATQPKFVLHCYSGSLESARELLKLDCMISFTGVLTFKNAKTAVAVATELPYDRVMIETDCPYLAPEPMRGKRNSSEYLIYTARKLAQLWDVDFESVCEITTKNARNFFNIGE